MKVGDIVEFRCPDILMDKKFETRGVGLLLDRRVANQNQWQSISFQVQWNSGEVSWEHKIYLEVLNEGR